MTDEQTPPDVDELVADEEPDIADVPEDVEPEGGMGLGAGILAGMAVGVVVAVIAALWFGSSGPRNTVDEANSAGAAASADAQPGPATLLRPATGTDIVPPERTGGGTLVLQNIGALDAVVVLADASTFARAVYVRTDERVTVPNVAAGNYEVLMMLGRDWSAGQFAHAATYQRLDQPIEFTERDTGSGAEYTRLTLSIEPVTAVSVGVRVVAPFQLTAP